MDKGCGANCEDDVDEFLLNLKTFRVNPPTSDPLQNRPSSYEDLVAELPDSVKELLSVCSFHTDLIAESIPDDLSIEEKNTLTYIGGFIIRKIRGKICESCKVTLIHDGSDLEGIENHLFTSMK